MSMISYQVETHQFNRNHAYYEELDYLCFLSKNIYNATLYEIRQTYFKTKSFPTWIDVCRKFVNTKNGDYYALNTKVSKGTMRMVQAAMNSFFTLLKKKREGSYTKRVCIPKYLGSKDGRQVVHFEKDALSFAKKPGTIHLSKTNIYVRSLLPKEQVKFVKVVPVSGQGIIKVLVGYKVELPTELPDNGHYAAIDLGVDNLMTLVSNIAKPLIVNGKPVKSINQGYNKQKAFLQSKLPKGQYNSKRIKSITCKRNNRITNYFRCVVRDVMNYLAIHSIHTLYVGYNKEWKQNIRLGKRTNQSFMSIPFRRLCEYLKEACLKRGIRYIEQEESYTSKCSFLDKESVEKHDAYLGKRIYRGLFRTKDGFLINADINAAYNILKKGLNVSWNDQIWLDCVEVCRASLLPRHTPGLNLLNPNMFSLSVSK